MKIKIVSWNIAGGRKIASLKQFDYNEQNLNYFIKELKVTNSNIVCLQESESSKNYSQPELLANELKMENIFSVPSHPSHINSNLMGNAIISSSRFLEKTKYKLPQLDWQPKWPDGRPVRKFDRYVLSAQVDNFVVTTVQLEPLGLWGSNYYQGQGVDYAKNVDKVLFSLSNKPMILCGDFSGDFLDDDVGKVLTASFKKYNFVDALPNKITRPIKNGGSKCDHIYYSPEFKYINGEVVKTDTDHYLCWAEFEL